MVYSSSYLQQEQKLALHQRLLNVCLLIEIRYLISRLLLAAVCLALFRACLENVSMLACFISYL